MTKHLIKHKSGVIKLAIIVIFVIVITLAVTSIVVSKSNASSHEDTNNYGNHRYVFTEKHEHYTITKTYDGPPRFIDGHEVSSIDDMSRWYVVKGFTEGIQRRLGEIEDLLESGKNEVNEDLSQEWKMRYDECQSVCKKHGIYRTHSTSPEAFNARYVEWKAKRKEYLNQYDTIWSEAQLFQQYLKNNSDKTCPRYIMISDISKAKGITRDETLEIYRRVRKEGYVKEYKDDSSRYIMVKSSSPEKPKKPKERELQPSVFKPELYAKIDKRLLYKIQYTVDEPQEINNDSNTCTFYSKSSGKRYKTSLEYCTCPAYCKTFPCKHMAKFAMVKGYINYSDFK